MNAREGAGENAEPVALDRVTAAWRRSGAGGRVVIVAMATTGAALAGACLFGLWHVVVGGLVRGNVRAAEFGVVLAAVTGVGLVGLARLARRLLAR